jgi:hypothetical protein
VYVIEDEDEARDHRRPMEGGDELEDDDDALLAGAQVDLHSRRTAESM